MPATQTQCEALRLMLGGRSGLAQGVYYNCLSGIDMGDAIYGIAQVSAAPPLAHALAASMAG